MINPQSFASSNAISPAPEGSFLVLKPGAHLVAHKGMYLKTHRKIIKCVYIRILDPQFSALTGKRDFSDSETRFLVPRRGFLAGGPDKSDYCALPNITCDVHLAGAHFRAHKKSRCASSRRKIRFCVLCGGPIKARNAKMFCSHACHNAWKAGRKLDYFHTPNSTKADRMRANGIVNKRIRLGQFNRPKTCMVCGKGGCRICAHHADYSKPNYVHFLCSSCHMKSHVDSSLLDGVTPLVVGAESIAWKYSNRKKAA